MGKQQMNLQWTFTDQTFVLSSDNGANSCIISTESFHIASWFATIKGCKIDYISKDNHNRTGLAVVVIGDLEQPFIGIQVNEAVIHDKALTLMSKYQMVEYDTIVDWRAKHYKVDHDETTRKQIIPPCPVMEIPLEFNTALMTMKIWKRMSVDW